MADYRRGLVDQIARDHWTLNHDPTPAPSYEFYVNRIEQYRQEVEWLDGAQ